MNVENVKWLQLIRKAAASNIDLQERAHGQFTDKGSAYACYGASVAVVELDCLTGEVSKNIQKNNKLAYIV